MNTPDQMQTDKLCPPAQNDGSWLAVAAMLADLAFETDRDGRFTAFGPGKVLGQPAGYLMGTAATAILFPAARAHFPADHAVTLGGIIASICTECVSWQGKVRIATGGKGLYRLALAPRITTGGIVAGTYGMLFDLETPELELPLIPAGEFGSYRPQEMLDTDTGFWTAKTFADEAARRFDRLDVEELPGTLLYLSFNRAPALHHSIIARRIAEELREIVRPTDLLGRVNATTIALWCDGMDHLTGAERASRFCSQLPSMLPGNAVITAGLAPRWPGTGDDPQTLMERAGVALRLADLATERVTEPGATGAWRVWQND